MCHFDSQSWGRDGYGEVIGERQGTAWDGTLRGETGPWMEMDGTLGSRYGLQCCGKVRLADAVRAITLREIEISMDGEGGLK